MLFCLNLRAMMHCITDSGSLDALSQTHSSLLISEWHLLENVLHADPTPSFFSFHILIYFIFNLCGCTFVGYATNWMPISPPKSMSKPNPQCHSTERWGLWEVIRSRAEPSRTGSGPFLETLKTIPGPLHHVKLQWEDGWRWTRKSSPP